MALLNEEAANDEAHHTRRGSDRRGVRGRTGVGGYHCPTGRGLRRQKSELTLRQILARVLPRAGCHAIERFAMEVQALGYVGIGASDLTDWTDFATNWLGMQMVERGNACRAFRMDDRKQRLVVDRSLADGERYFGFEVADRAALDGLAARLEAAGVAVRREPTALADQ